MDAAPGPRAALSEGLEAAGLTLGAALLAGSVLVAAALPDATRPGLLLQSGGALLVAGGGVLLLVRTRGAARAAQLAVAGLLMVGGAAVMLVAVAPAAVPRTTAAFPLTATTLALVGAAGFAGRRRAPVLVGAVVVVAVEALHALLGPRLGLRWTPAVPPLVLLGLIAALTLGFRGVLARLAGARRAAASAAEQDALVRTRAIARSRSAAVVHDGVLGDLAALTALPAGPLPPRASASLRATLDLLAAPDWGPSEPTGPVALPGGAVLEAVRRAERAGLVVLMDGDPTPLRRLDPAVELALGRAVEQCLANTRLHAGVDRAEVTVLSDRDGVSVMVADAGAGFEPAAVEADRMGLSTSVASRLAAVGGQSRLFARPGVGTTVLLTVPTGSS